jgi:hypothetical protein
VKLFPYDRADPTMQIGRPRIQTWIPPNTSILVFIDISPGGAASLTELFFSRLRTAARKLRWDAGPITGARALS